MTYRKIIILVLFVFIASPALAGEVTYKDMRGKWGSTQCSTPVTKPPYDPSSEAAANDLNTQVMQHNQFVAEARAYMDCIAQEAKNDGEALSYLVGESAKMLIEDMQKQINNSSFHIKKKTTEDGSLF